MRIVALGTCAVIMAVATPADANAQETASPTAARQKPVPSAIRQFFQSYFRAVEAGDPDGILAHIDEDFVIKWPVGTPISDRARLRAALAGMQQRIRQEIKWGIEEAHVAGDWAWVRSWESPTHYPKAGGAPRTLSGWRLTILRKMGGRWLIHRDTASLNELQPRLQD